MKPDSKKTVFDFIVKYKYNHDGCSPSGTDIANETHYSKSHANRTCKELRDAGLIRFNQSQHCAFEIVGGYIGAYKSAQFEARFSGEQA